MVCEKWYKHQPEPIREAKEATIFVDFCIQNDRKIKKKLKTRSSCSGLQKKKTCVLIDMLLPTNDYISVKIYFKIIKCKKTRKRNF